MVRRPLRYGALASICLLALLLPSLVQAQVLTNSCRAEGRFGSCNVTCPAGRTPVCKSSKRGTSVSCTCEGGFISPLLGVSHSHKMAFDGYTDVLSTFSSGEAETVLGIALKMMEAALKNDGAAYLEAAAAHDALLEMLPTEELEKVDKYLGVPKP